MGCSDGVFFDLVPQNGRLCFGWLQSPPPPIISVPFLWKLSEVGTEQGFNVIIANIHLKPNPRRKVIRFNGHRPSEWKSTGFDLLNLIRPCFSLSHPNCVSISALTPGLIQRAKFSLYAAMESCLLFLHCPHVSQGPLSQVLPTWYCMVAIYIAWSPLGT